MYSRSKVSERIAIAEAEFGFSLEPHTVAEVDAFDAHLVASGMYEFDDSGRPSAVVRLSDLEREWIQNEQALVLCDADYFLSHYAYIKDEQNVIRRFQFRTPQRLLYEIIAGLEERDAAIEVMILKARQLGMSTLVELLIAHRIIFGYGVNAIIGSADQTKTALMANMLFLCYDYLPVWLRPQWTRRVESDRGMLVFGASSSGVSFQHGAQASGIARGTTPTVYHLSECASFTDPVNQIEASLFRAVHASPNVFGILESTGEGDKGWWPDTWRHAKSNWHLNRARLCPLFLPWFCGTDIYPTPTWIGQRPVPADWRPNRDTREHVAKAELYVRSSPLLSRHLGSAWRMPQAQQWFWEVEHEQAKAKGIESVFLQEMAGDDEEALQRSVESVFGHETIAEISATRNRDYAVYGLSGQSIEDDHEPPPDDIDYNAERIPVRYQSKKAGAAPYLWELIPLTFSTPLRENNPDDAIGKLIVFRPPAPGVSYSIGVDTGGGKGEDSTVVSVWSIGARGLPDIQAAEFASPYVNHVEAFSFVFAIAAYYGQFMREGMTPEYRWQMPYLTVEQVEAVGDVCQLQCIRMGYPVRSVHVFTRLDSSPARIARQKKTATKLGWYTYGWSRPILTTTFVNSAKNNWIKINSPWLVEEMRHFEVHSTATGKEKLEHEEGEHDDRIFAAAMATTAPHLTEDMSERSKKRPTEAAGLPLLDLAPYRGGVVSAADIRRTAKSASESWESLVYGGR